MKTRNQEEFDTQFSSSSSSFSLNILLHLSLLPPNSPRPSRPRRPPLFRAPPAVLSRCFTVPFFLLSQLMNSRTTASKFPLALPLQSALYFCFLFLGFQHFIQFACRSLFFISFVFLDFFSQFSFLCSELIFCSVFESVLLYSFYFFVLLQFSFFISFNFFL